MDTVSNQLARVRERLAELDPNNRDHLYEISELKTREAELSRLLKQEEAEADLQREHEERVQQSVEAVVNILDTVDIHGLTLRELCAGEKEYQLLSIWVKQQFAQQAETLSKQINAEVAENKRLRDELAEAEKKIVALQELVNTLNGEINTVKFERDQAITYRDNAAAQLEEALKEVKRLESQLDDLRKEIAVGARNAYKVVDVTSPEYGEQLKKMAEEIKNSRIPVTVMENVDALGRKVRVVLAETGEERTIGFLEKGKYRLVDAQEAAEVAERFRQAQVGLSTSNSEEAVAEPVTFQVEAPKVELHGVHEGATPADNGSEREDIETLGAVSREEFEALKARVAKLEGVA